tara:strand:- start:176 stop:388 length:213 start_codon:yes stop_codon:yes gene_type:complete
MKILSKIIIVILILLVIGLYFKPDFTKDKINTVGKAALNVGKETVEEIKETDIYKNATGSIKEKIPFVES